MIGSTEKASLCISCHLFRAHVYEYAQGLMNRISVISNNSQVYLKQMLGNFNIKSTKVKAKYVQHFSCKMC